MSEKVIMDAGDVQRALVRLSHELVERNKGAQGLVLIGIQRRGVPLARRIAKLIDEHEKVSLPVGVLDITFYRDDLSILSEHPTINGTDIPFPIHDKRIVIVDDVIYTGRTVRAAIDALMDMARPRSIQLMVMVDRGHRELPIRADYVGKNVPTASSEIIHVMVSEMDGQDQVLLSQK